MFPQCNILDIIMGMIAGCIIIFVDSVVFGIVIATTIDGNMETRKQSSKWASFRKKGEKRKQRGKTDGNMRKRGKQSVIVRLNPSTWWQLSKRMLSGTQCLLNY